MTRSARARTLAVAGGLVAGLTLGVLSTPAGQAAPARATSGSLVAAPTSAVAGADVELAGRSGPAAVHPVRLQLKKGKRWVVVDRGRTTTTGRFGFVVELPPGVAAQRFRVLTPQTPTSRRSVTPVVKVVAQPAAPLLSGDVPTNRVTGVISGDGRYVLDGDSWSARVREIATGVTVAVPREGRAVDISDDGGAVLMDGLDLAPPFVWFRTTGEFVEVAPELRGTEEIRSDAASISGDGTTILVALTENATGIRQGLYVQDLETGAVDQVPGEGGRGDLSYDGRYVVAIGSDGMIRHDMETGETVDVAPTAYQYDLPSISDDGRYVAAWLMTPAGGDEVDVNVWLMDLVTGTAEPSPIEGEVYATYPKVSDDGQRIVFSRYRPVPDGIDSMTTAGYLWDRSTGAVRSLTSPRATDGHIDLTISDDGTAAVGATNLRLGLDDVDDAWDLYFFDLPG